MKSVKTDDLPLLLEKASIYGGKLTQPNQVPIQCSIIDISVRDDGRLLIRLMKELPIREDRTIFIDLNYRDIFFRLQPKQFFVKGDLIYAVMPDDARALVRRSEERYLLPTHITTAVRRSEKREKAADLTGEIVDISRHGLALKFHDLKEGALMNNDHLWLREVHGQALDRPLFGRVIYLSPSRSPRAGVALDGPVPKDLFEELRRLSETVLAV